MIYPKQPWQKQESVFLPEFISTSLRSPRYLLLDEMIDSGLPFTTEMNRLEDRYFPS